jgi:hypothetical protein
MHAMQIGKEQMTKEYPTSETGLRANVRPETSQSCEGGDLSGNRQLVQCHADTSHPGLRQAFAALIIDDRVMRT